MAIMTRCALLPPARSYPVTVAHTTAEFKFKCSSQQHRQSTVSPCNVSRRNRVCKKIREIVALGPGALLFSTLSFAGDSHAAGFGQVLDAAQSLIEKEPSNALSLPTWAIHVSSVVEWILAMALVWQYGEKSGFPTWKGLSWGMVPLLGGALCACTWHFFYNAESLEILVLMQAALTVLGNCTMSLAAFRIYKSTRSRPET